MDSEWTGPVVMHLLAPDEHLLMLVLAVGAFASGLVITLAIAALFRRRSWSYLLVTIALGTLLVRTVFGIMDVGGTIDPTAHHVVEHGLDVVIVVLLLGAVYCARTVDLRGDRNV